MPATYSKEISATGAAGTYKGVITITFNYGTNESNNSYHLIEIEVNGMALPEESVRYTARAQTDTRLTNAETKLTNFLTAMANQSITDPVEVAMRNKGYDLVYRKRN
jgi:N-formylglutamate amidohydrolase